MKVYDIVIIGAGPAGATAALCLKSAGLNVAIIDKAVFPRDKICGDAVSSIAKRILRQINPDLETELLSFEPKSAITKAKLHAPNFNQLEVTFTKTGHCIKRFDFDNWLFEQALKHNRTLQTFLGNEVKHIEYGENCVHITLSNGEVLQCSMVIACDGAQSIVAKKLAHFKVDRKHYSGAVRQYYRNVAGMEGNALEVYFLKGYLPGYFWIFPLGNNEANVGFGMLSETIAQKQINLKSHLNEIITTIPQVAERFKNAECLESVKGFGLPLGSRKYPISGERFLLCGDAAALIDPFSGEGIERAMESGKFAAEMAIEACKRNDFTATFFKAYDKRVYQKMWPIFRNHYYMQRLLGQRVRLINFLISFGNIPWVNRQITRLFY